MGTPNWSPPEIDVSRPSAARVYDYYLGGSHNFEVDRQMAEEAIRLWPELPGIIRANRAFMRRAVTFLASEGVQQYIDIGSGIPTVGNVHEVAGRASPEARVVYVDRDPVAVEHSRALLGDDPRTAVVRADLRRPDDILNSPEVQRMIDFSQPAALLLVAVLHFVSDEDAPGEAVQRLCSPLSAGSYLVISHASPSVQSDKSAEHQELYRRTPTPMTMRTRDEIAGFFTGFDLVPPGLVPLSGWRPDAASVDLAEAEVAGKGGVGRKR
jgi:hypothetical protein